MILLSCQTLGHSQQKIEFNDVALPEALRILANALHKNIIVSGEVIGTVSMQVQAQSIEKAFNRLIEWHDLAIECDDGVFLIMPKEKQLQQRQHADSLNKALLATEPLETHLFKIRYATVENIGLWLSDKKSNFLSERGNLHIDKRTNQLIVEDTHQKLQQIADLLKQLDIPVQQIMIETRLASVDSHFERELGLDFSVLEKDQEESHRNANNNNPIHSYGLVIARLADGNLLDVRLKALENTGHGELISSPKLFTANREPAMIESGEEIPYQEISRSGATGVSFRKAVLSLQVIPQILPNRLVQLQLKINQDKPASRIIQGVPAITTRQISSNVLIKNGQTIVLGGIYENDQNEVNSGIPILSRIPLIGNLFQQKSVFRNKRELLIFVTPHIIDPP